MKAAFRSDIIAGTLVFASDAEVNIVTVTLVCPDWKTQTIRAYREEAQLLREFIRSRTLK